LKFSLRSSEYAKTTIDDKFDGRLSVNNDSPEGEVIFKLEIDSFTENFEIVYFCKF
jgi:hypothetical protein